MLCPVDQTELRIVERQGVEIDYCPSCRGVWLDRGELDKIVDRTLGDVGGSASPVTARSERDSRYERDRRDDDYRRDRPYGDGGRRYDDDDDDRRYGSDDYRRRRRGSWLGELFDFD